MRVSRLDQGPEVLFVLTDVPPHLEEAVTRLAFQPFEDGFAQRYPADYPHMDRVYANFERLVGDLVLQRARLVPVAWEEALLTFCRAVEGGSVDWWLTGSGALAVRGLPVTPGDLDLAIDRESATRAEELMLDSLIEPPRPGFISDTFARAFPGACLEWCVGIDGRADQYLVGDVGLTAASRLETVVWKGYEIRVPPLDLQLVVNRHRGYEDRARMIEQALARRAG